MDRVALRGSLQSNVEYVFSRSGGSGGQNVNKVNTRVQLFVPLTALEGITGAEFTQIRKNLGSRINKNGELFVSVQDERSQERNREIALDRLEALIVKAARILPKRKKTKPTAASREKRLKGKKERSLIKQLRQKV